LAFFYWFDKPWFLTEGKLAAVLIIPSSWGFQLGGHLHQHRTAIISVMPFSLYKRLDLEKWVSTDISLQMADKSTTIPIGICENVPVQVANNCLILTDFVVLEMPEDDNMSIIIGRPFLNIAGAIINCNQGKVTFNVNDKEYMIYFPKKIDRKNALNSIKNVETIKVGQIYCLERKPKEEYKIVMIGTMPIKVEVT
jgi:hypothetical protein